MQCQMSAWSGREQRTLWSDSDAEATTEPEKNYSWVSSNTKINEKAYGTNRTVFIDCDCKKYSQKTRIAKVIVKKADEQHNMLPQICKIN